MSVFCSALGLNKYKTLDILLFKGCLSSLLKHSERKKEEFTTENEQDTMIYNSSQEKECLPNFSVVFDFEVFFDPTHILLGFYHIILLQAHIYKWLIENKFRKHGKRSKIKMTKWR
jgi:hypothetical protein